MDNRQHLLDVALKLFAIHGYEGVGVQAVVEAAGVTKPTLYHYFGSKRGLFEALVNEQGESLLAMAREATAYQGDIRASIKRVVQSYFDYASRRPIFYRMLLSLWFAPPESECSTIIAVLFDQQHVLLEQMFQQAEADHGNMRGRSQLYAISLKGMIDTYIGLSLQSKLDVASEHLQYRIIHQFMHGIFS